MGAPDKGVPQEVLDHAKCVAVVPHMIKAGPCVWRREWQRRGHLPHRKRVGSAPAFFAITGGNWGCKSASEGVILVMIFQGDKGMARLENAKYPAGADASPHAGPVGRHASAIPSWKLNTEILT